MMLFEPGLKRVVGFLSDLDKPVPSRGRFEGLEGPQVFVELANSDGRPVLQHRVFVHGS